MSFSYEKETRLFYTPKDSDEIKFRVKGNFIIPYFEMPQRSLNKDKKMPITSITVGPSTEQELIIKSIYEFMVINGYKTVEVNASLIPYRIR